MKTDRGWDPRFLLVICLAGAASSISWRTVDPMLPVMSVDLGVSLTDAALLSTAYSVPMALAALFFGPAGDALGKVRLIRVALALVALSQLVVAIAPNFTTVFLARAVAGVFAGGLNPVSIALIGDRVPMEHRQVALSRFLIASILAQTLGAAAAGVLSEVIGWRPVFVIVGLAVAAVLAATVLLPKEEPHPAKWPKLGTILAAYASVFTNRTSQLILGTLMLEGLLVLGLLPFVGGLVVTHAGGGATEAGLVIAAFAAGGIVYGFIVRRLLATLGRWNLVRAGGIAIAAGFIATLLPVHWSVITLFFFVAGLGFYMFHGTIQNLATEILPGARGTAMSLVAFFFYVGQGLGPVIGGQVAVAAGYDAVYAAGGVLMLLLGFGIARLLTGRIAKR